MKRTFNILLLIFIFNVFAGRILAQGFDWQYSPRIPYSQPKLFVGLAGSISKIINTGSFSFLEDHIPCCDYNAGYGTSIAFGLKTEYWQTGLLALNSGIILTVNSSNFSTIISIPRSDGKIDYISTYNYFLDESRIYLGAEFGAKYRILNSHFSIGGDLNLHYKLNSTATHKEQILTPKGETFIDGSTERIITNGIIGNYNNILLLPNIYLNYDMSISQGYYASYCLYTTFPLTSVVQIYNWREWKFGLSVQIFKSFK